MLTFTSLNRVGEDGRVLWNAVCDCGNTTVVIPFNVANSKRPIKSCGCYGKSVRQKNGEKCRRYEPRISSARCVWQWYDDKECDFESFLKVSQLPCHYCGQPPYTTFNRANVDKKNYHPSDYQREEGNFIYNGLDRIDSSKTHSLDNIVPCCWTCNRMKGNMLYHEFVNHVKLMNAHFMAIAP
jgi:hypothetical protein